MYIHTNIYMYMSRFMKTHEHMHTNKTNSAVYDDPSCQHDICTQHPISFLTPLIFCDRCHESL